MAIPEVRGQFEKLLFGLFRGGEDEEETFDRLKALTGGKYPLLAYLYFLRDMDRFAPIQPTGFDRAFKALGIAFSTLGQCSWENYSAFNVVLSDLRPRIEAEAHLKTVRLIDAHSFCWIYSTLLKEAANGFIGKPTGSKDEGSILDGRKTSIIKICMSVENTVKNSNGQVEERIVKNKELRMTTVALEDAIAALLDSQGNRCNLTGIPLQFHGAETDPNLVPSLDRIDSDGHYEHGNLQVVCRFINFWKSDSDNEEFKRLLMLIRDIDA